MRADRQNRRCRGTAGGRRTSQHAKVSGRQSAPQRRVRRRAEETCRRRELHCGAAGTCLGLISSALYLCRSRAPVITIGWRKTLPLRRSRSRPRSRTSFSKCSGRAPPASALSGKPSHAAGDLTERFLRSSAAPFMTRLALTHPVRCEVVGHTSPSAFQNPSAPPAFARACDAVSGAKNTLSGCADTLTSGNVTDVLLPEALPAAVPAF